MSEEALRERIGVLAVHEMPAWHLFDKVIPVEHAGGTPIVRGLRNGISEPGKHDRGHGDSRLQ